MGKQSPKLRTVNKSIPPYKLNEFGSEFPYILAKEIVYLLASKGLFGNHTGLNLQLLKKSQEIV